MALAAGGSEDVAHQAVGVHADQHWLVAGFNIATNEGYVRLAAIDLALVGDEAELAEAGVDQRLAHAMYVALMRHAVADQLRDRQHLHVVLLAELDQVW